MNAWKYWKQPDPIACWYIKNGTSGEATTTTKFGIHERHMECVCVCDMVQNNLQLPWIEMCVVSICATRLCSPALPQRVLHHFVHTAHAHSCMNRAVCAVGELIFASTNIVAFVAMASTRHTCVLCMYEQIGYFVARCTRSIRTETHCAADRTTIFFHQQTNNNIVFFVDTIFCIVCYKSKKYTDHDDEEKRQNNPHSHFTRLQSTNIFIHLLKAMANIVVYRMWVARPWLHMHNMHPLDWVAAVVECISVAHAMSTSLWCSMAFVASGNINIYRQNTLCGFAKCHQRNGMFLFPRDICVVSRSSAHKALSWLMSRSAIIYIETIPQNDNDDDDSEMKIEWIGLGVLSRAAAEDCCACATYTLTEYLHFADSNFDHPEIRLRNKAHCAAPSEHLIWFWNRRTTELYGDHIRRPASAMSNKQRFPLS